MATELGLGLSEQALRDELEGELVRAMHAEGDVPTLHAIAHAVARVIELDHLKIAAQLRAAGVDLDRARADARAARASAA